jgi:septum site-determining protein MinD
MTARVITVTSGKGGVGKTTATANLGVALASLGNKVVCLDADIGLRNLDVVMGLENRIVYDLVDVVEGRAKLRQAMIKDKRMKEELYLIPAAQTRDKTAVSPSDMIRVCDELKPLVDYVLVDSPAGIERGFRNAVAPADDVIIVTNPEVSSVRDADRIIGLIEAEGKGPGYLIVNRVKADMVRRGDMLSPADILDILAIKLIGLIPEDETILVSTNRGLPVAMNFEESRAGTAFRNIGRRIMGEAVPFLALEEEAGFLQRVFGRKGRQADGADPSSKLKPATLPPLKTAEPPEPRPEKPAAVAEPVRAEPKVEKAVESRAAAEAGKPEEKAGRPAVVKTIPTVQPLAPAPRPVVSESKPAAPESKASAPDSKPAAPQAGGDEKKPAEAEGEVKTASSAEKKTVI